MELNFLQSLILGLVSGAAEVLPLNGQAHRLLYIKILGGAGENPDRRRWLGEYQIAPSPLQFPRNRRNFDKIEKNTCKIRNGML